MGNDLVQALKHWSCPQRLPEPTVKVRGDRKTCHDAHISEQFMLTKPALQDTHMEYVPRQEREIQTHELIGKKTPALMKEQIKN